MTSLKPIWYDIWVHTMIHIYVQGCGRTTEQLVCHGATVHNWFASSMAQKHSLIWTMSYSMILLSKQFKISWAVDLTIVGLFTKNLSFSESFKLAFSSDVILATNRF